MYNFFFCKKMEEVRKNSSNLVVFPITLTHTTCHHHDHQFCRLDWPKKISIRQRVLEEIWKYSRIHHEVMHAWNISQVYWNRSKNIQVKVVHRKYAARFELETCHMLDMALILNLLCCAMISNPMMIDDANDRDFFTSFSPHFPTNTQKKI